MVANAVQRHAFAVQQKTVVGGELDGADAERCFIAVHRLAVLFDGSDDDMAFRFLDAPKPGVFAGDLSFSRLGLVGGNFHTVGGERSDGLAFGPVRAEFKNVIFQRHDGVSIAVVVQLHLDFHRCRFGADFRRSDIGAPVGHVDRFGFDEPHIAVNAAARVPARRVRRVVEADGDDVVRAEFDVRRQIHLPRSVAVGPAADELAVEPDRCASHGAIHGQMDFFALVGSGNLQMFAIPGNAPPRQLAGFAGVFLFEGPFDAPVVRQVQQPPLAVIETALRIRNVAAAGIALRFFLRDQIRIGGELRAGGLDPILDVRIGQFAGGIGGIILGKPPARVQREAFPGRG